MARIKDKEKAIQLRVGGYSYSQIKSEMGLSKSTLSNWLKDYPLSEERIKELRDTNPERIERCRNTKKRKVEKRLSVVYEKVKIDISQLTRRELFIAGLFLYWGEGSKSERFTSGLSNTDPSMIRFFLTWLRLMDVKEEKFNITLQLYADMDVSKEIEYWSKELSLPKKMFRRFYIKKSALAGLTYKRGFGHGTCNVRIYSRDLADYVHMAMKHLALMNS